MSDLMTLDRFYSEYEGKDVKWFKGYRKDWMSDDQWLCNLFLQRLFKGFHHIPTEPKECGSGIQINFRPSYFATFDYDYLTKLVIMAHNWGVRADIGGSGPAMVKLILFKRHKREGRMCERHPTIGQSVEMYKDY